MKTRGEKSIEALTWASVVMWLGFALIMHLLDYAWLVLMVLGIILLSSAIYQRSRGLAHLADDLDRRRVDGDLQRDRGHERDSHRAEH